MAKIVPSMTKIVFMTSFAKNVSDAMNRIKQYLSDET